MSPVCVLVHPKKNLIHTYALVLVLAFCLVRQCKKNYFSNIVNVLRFFKGKRFF